MPSKSEILASLAKEARITSHLASRLRPEHLPFRFTPGQRSTQELLEYLATHVENGLSFLLTGSREGADARRAAVKGIALDRIPEALAAQQAAAERLLAPFDEPGFAAHRVRNGQGVELPLAEALFEGLVKQAVGYKTQLFLQAKAAGVSGLGSNDLWRGESAQAARS
jgi:hypothetical protein